MFFRSDFFLNKCNLRFCNTPVHTLTSCKVSCQVLFFYLVGFARTPPYMKLTELLTKKSLLADIKQISGRHTTSSPEAFHSVYNHFAPKLLPFSYHGMISRYSSCNLFVNSNSQILSTVNGNTCMSTVEYIKNDMAIRRELSRWSNALLPVLDCR